eukprot:CAMPEP_0170569282 /NCGR_PEP_ID=MMETSP0224-20130122/453_1 /TAXON_ID=285029 /ORGANISM="Togula jolla, Strain CCCM 725" /LENGTH=265 /DNA_ID=CAMNT_0010891401 /DNA_START=24 /DNA_END=818 /DNA_ORIENTATION=+
MSSDEDEEEHMRGFEMEEYHRVDHMRVGCLQEEGLPKKWKEHIQDDLLAHTYWTGNYLIDYLFFVCNWHPFIGLFLSHPGHPWSKFERFLTFLISCSLTMLPSALMLLWLGHGLVGKGALFVCVSLPVMILEVILYQLAVVDTHCDDCQCIRFLARLIKNSCLCCSLTFSISIVCFSGLIVTMNNEPLVDLVEPFCWARLYSWAVWFPVMFFMPCCGFCCAWRMDRDAFLAEEAKKDSDSEGGAAAAEARSEARSSSALCLSGAG